jgi:Fur family zinc uptake transcriptional regulator
MIDYLLDKAYQHCIKKGYRYTAPRAHVLKILINEGKPLGAYDILERLSQEIMKKPNPPTVYRAIQFWHEEGFIHCIDSLKSYIACCHGHHIGQTHFLICQDCHFVKEVETMIDITPLKQAALPIQFSIKNCTVEIKGLCFNCHPK